jgi:hypothetical protein
MVNRFGQKAASRVKRMTKHFRRTFGWLMMPLLAVRFRALAAGEAMSSWRVQLIFVLVNVQ